jgi:hypothetical protein
MSICGSCQDLHRKAQHAVHKALKEGRLTKPDQCSACGRKPFKSRDLKGHHHSYDEANWLDVKWLCQSCHHRAHQDPAAPNCKQSVQFPVVQREKYCYAGTPQDAARVGYTLTRRAS